MISGLVIARFISPEDYGIWGVLSLVTTYASFLQLGIINGVNLELPIALGEGKKDKLNKIIATSQCFILISIILLFFIMIIFFGLNNTNLNIKMKYGIIAIVVITMFTFYQDFLTATFRTPKSFLRFSKINLIQAFINFITILLIIYYSYYGLLLKGLFVIIINVILLHFYRPYKVKIEFDKETFIKLLKVGSPIFLLAYLQASAIGFDRVLLAKYSSLSDIGIYSFAYLAFSSLTILSSSIASYIYPTMSHMYAVSKDKNQLWNFVMKNITLVFFGLLIIGCLGFFIVPFIITEFFSQYVNSISVMRILIFAGVFQGSVIGVNVLLSIKKWKLVIIYHLVFILLLLICPMLLIRFWSGSVLNAVAIGVLIANIINFFNAHILVYIGLKVNQDEK